MASNKCFLFLLYWQLAQIELKVTLINRDLFRHSHISRIVARKSSI